MPGTFDRSRTAGGAVGRWRLVTVAALLPLALLLAACGKSSDDDAPIPPAATPTAEPTSPATAANAAGAAPAPAPAIPVTAAPGAIQAPPVEAPAPAAPTTDEVAPEAAPGPATATPTVTPVAPAAPAVPTALPAPAAPVPGAQAEPTPAAPVGANPAPVAAAPPNPAVTPATAAATPAAAAVSATTTPVVETDPALVARLAVADAAAGRTVAARCSACHTVDAGAPDGNGPNLYDIVGAPIGAHPGFTYSPAFQTLAATGATWTYDRLDAFLGSPAVTVPGTRMGFGGLSDEVQRANLIAYLRTLSADPVPLPGTPAADPFRAEIMALGLRPVTFTATQVQIGHDNYVRNCSTCHGASFQGIFYGAEWGQAPPLIGDRFERRWYLRTLAAFVTAMAETDILNYASLHQGLSPDQYTAIAAYLLEQYGFVAGDVPLPVERGELAGIGFWQ